MNRLTMLDDAIAATTSRVVSARPDWPCRRGCDHCCRNLASPMPISQPEWSRLARHLGQLDDRARSAFDARIDDPRVCPLLDRETGACTAYDARPIACRAYGFYAGREGGTWCAAVEELPGLSEVIVGNHDALERSLGPLGETRTLAEWWRAGLASTSR